MDIIVCVKRIPVTQEVDIEISETGNDIKKESLSWFINEWDNYAVEEAVLLRDKTGGTVTAITIGSEDDEEVLRRCLAVGADRAIRIDPGDITPDSYVTGRMLAEIIKGLPHDLILTGVQSEDLNSGMTGTILAEHLNIAHASVVTEVIAENDHAKIKIELEGGTDAQVKIKLPALLTIQTGINEPRYVSIMGIRKASKKEIILKKVGELNLSREDITPRTKVEELYLPPESEGATMIEGDPEHCAMEIIRIIREKGVDI